LAAAGRWREAGHPAGGRTEVALKEVIAIVKPFVAERVLESLRHAPLEACAVREVKGFGRQKNYLDEYGESEFSNAFLPKVEIQLWIEDARLEEVLACISEAARTGRMGDGKILVLPAAEAWRGPTESGAGLG